MYCFSIFTETYLLKKTIIYLYPKLSLHKKKKINFHVKLFFK